MKIINLFHKKESRRQNSSFADFFLYASEKEKKKTIAEAAKRANKEQRTLIKKLEHKAT